MAQDVSVINQQKEKNMKENKQKRLVRHKNEQEEKRPKEQVTLTSAHK